MNDFLSRQGMVLSTGASKMIPHLRVMVVGAGALGNEVLKNLALMGIRYITVVEFDTIEASNLSRAPLFGKKDIGRKKAEVAAEKLREMCLGESPEIRSIDGDIMTDVGKGLFLEHDIVISCVDTKKGRAYLSDMCVKTHTPFFEGGFEGYSLSVSFFAPVGPMKQKDGRIIDKLPTSDGYFPELLGEFPVCLREEIGTGSFSETRNSCSGFKAHDTELAKIPTIQSGSAATGALIVQELVKYLDGKDTLRNQMFLMSGLSLESIKIQYKRDPKCTVHDVHLNLLTVPVSKDITIGEAIEAVKMKTGGDNVVLRLPDEYIISGCCHICGERGRIGMRTREMWDDRRWCDKCRGAYPDYAERILHPNDFIRIPCEISEKSSDKILSYKLSEVGVPENDILECLVSRDGSFEEYDVYFKTEMI